MPAGSDRIGGRCNGNGNQEDRLAGGLRGDRSSWRDLVSVSGRDRGGRGGSAFGGDARYDSRAVAGASRLDGALAGAFRGSYPAERIPTFGATRLWQAERTTGFGPIATGDAGAPDVRSRHASRHCRPEFYWASLAADRFWSVGPEFAAFRVWATNARPWLCSNRSRASRRGTRRPRFWSSASADPDVAEWDWDRESRSDVRSLSTEHHPKRDGSSTARAGGPGSPAVHAG